VLAAEIDSSRMPGRQILGIMDLLGRLLGGSDLLRRRDCFLLAQLRGAGR
jgi:hypothetical protein